MNQLSRTDLDEIKKKVYFYLSVHRFEAAEKLLKTTLANHPKLANVHNMLGLSFHKQSKFQEAIEQFQLAIQANSSYIEASLNLAATYCDISQYDLAKEIFDKLDGQLHPRTKIPHLLHGRLANQHAENGHLYADNNLNAEAILEYKKALDLFPNMPDVKINLTQIYLKENELEKARKQVEELLAAHPNHTRAHTLLGLILYKLGRDEQAKAAWQKAKKSDPEDLMSRAYIKISDSMNSRLS